MAKTNNNGDKVVKILPTPKPRTDVDYVRESQLLLWLWKIIDEISFSHEYEQYLRDGVILCHLMNFINNNNNNNNNKNQSIIDKGDNKIKKIENINKFLQFCRKYGLNEDDLFNVEDLLSMLDMPKVTKCLYLLGQSIAEKNGNKLPILGKPYDEWLSEQINDNNNNDNIDKIGTKIYRRNGMPFGDDIFISHVDTDWLKKRFKQSVDNDSKRIRNKPKRDPLIQRQPSISMNNLKDIFLGKNPPLQYDWKKIDSDN